MRFLSYCILWGWAILSSAVFAQETVPAEGTSALAADPVVEEMLPTPADTDEHILVLQVNNDAVTSDEVVENLKSDIGEEALRQWRTDLPDEQFHRRLYENIGRITLGMVYNKLLYQHALEELQENENFDKVLESELESQKKRYLTGFEGNEALAREKLAEKDLSLDRIMEGIKEEMVVENYRQKHFAPARGITRWHLRQYYQRQLAEEFTLKSQVTFQLIDIRLEPDREQARQRVAEALAQAQSGADFGELVKTYSQGLRKAQDGIWGPYDPDSLQETYQPVVKALKSLSTGQITDLIEGKDRFFIARLLYRQEAGVRPFPEVQHEIQQKIGQERWQAFREKLNRQLLDDAVVGQIGPFAERLAGQVYESYSR